MSNQYPGQPGQPGDLPPTQVAPGGAPHQPGPPQGYPQQPQQPQQPYGAPGGGYPPPGPPPFGAPPTGGGGGKKTGLILGIIGAIVLLLIIAAVLLFAWPGFLTDDDDDDDADRPEVTQTVTQDTSAPTTPPTTDVTTDVTTPPTTDTGGAPTEDPTITAIAYLNSLAEGNCLAVQGLSTPEWFSTEYGSQRACKRDAGNQEMSSVEYDFAAEPVENGDGSVTAVATVSDSTDTSGTTYTATWTLVPSDDGTTWLVNFFLLV